MSTGFKIGALRFNVGTALRLPAVVSRRAERRLEEIELFKLLTALEKHPRNRAIVEALYGTGARVDELAQLKCRQLVADLEGTGGYVTLYGKHGARTIRVSPQTWAALQWLAECKEPDDRIVTITDERIRQILTAAAAAAGLKKKLSPHWLRHAHGSHAHQRGAPAATIRDTLGPRLAKHDGFVSQLISDRWLESLTEILTYRVRRFKVTKTERSALYFSFRNALFRRIQAPSTRTRVEKAVYPDRRSLLAALRCLTRSDREFPYIRAAPIVGCPLSGEAFQRSPWRGSDRCSWGSPSEPPAVTRRVTSNKEREDEAPSRGWCPLVAASIGRCTRTWAIHQYRHGLIGLEDATRFAGCYSHSVIGKYKKES